MKGLQCLLCCGPFSVYPGSAQVWRCLALELGLFPAVPGTATLVSVVLYLDEQLKDHITPVRFGCDLPPPALFKVPLLGLPCVLS